MRAWQGMRRAHRGRGQKAELRAKPQKHVPVRKIGPTCITSGLLTSTERCCAVTSVAAAGAAPAAPARQGRAQAAGAGRVPLPVEQYCGVIPIGTYYGARASSTTVLRFARAASPRGACSRCCGQAPASPGKCTGAPPGVPPARPPAATPAARFARACDRADKRRTVRHVIGVGWGGGWEGAGGCAGQPGRIAPAPRPRKRKGRAANDACCARGRREGARERTVGRAAGWRAARGIC